MAIGMRNDTSVSNSQSFTPSKIYTGFASFSVVGVNPTKTELSELLGREITEEPAYVGETNYTHPITGEEKKIKTARIDFWLKNEELDILTKMTFFFQNTPWISNSGKCKVIDKYGQTAWVTAEEYSNRLIPTYASGAKANIDADYRASFRNEEELVKFIRKYYNIPNPSSYNKDTKSWDPIADQGTAVCQLDHIQEYFKGNFDELKKDIFPQNTPNKVRVLLGARIIDGNMYQDVFTEEFSSNIGTYTQHVEKACRDRQAHGGYPNTIFAFGEAVEYKATSHTGAVNTNIVINAAPTQSSIDLPF